MRVYHSNRLEKLACKLARLIATDPAEPLEPERIVVPHPTMKRWLQLELARELGIAANIDFQLPAEFAWSILRDAVPSLSKARGFDPGNLRWHLFELLPQFAGEAEGGEIRRFLADRDERKKFELADKLAAVFDRCINFRDDWIRDWEQGKTPHWQARLWQLLAEKVPERHWVYALDAFERGLARGVRPQTWPQRAFVFGVSGLSPSYLRLLRQVAGHIELHVFQFNPSSGYWSDLRTEREIRNRVEAGDPQEQHFEEGNKLLAAWGRAGRGDFESLIADEDNEEQIFLPAGTESRLAAVQGDIQEAQGPAEVGRSDAVPSDNSLQIHCCHSAMREAEVLHDRLLDLLESNPDIEPADILIVTPDLARYGPAIAAVFEAEGRIPVVLSRFREADSPTSRAFFDLLSLPGSRYGAEAVLAPLDAPSLRARFRLRENNLPAIRNWVREAGVRRGVSADGGDYGQAPALPGNTWREGLQRLLMGYAAGDANDLVLGVFPGAVSGETADAASEADFEILGRFITYCSSAIDLQTLAGQSRTANQWSQILLNLLGRFFDEGSDIAAYGGFEAARDAADEVKAIRTLIENFRKQASRADCPIPFDVVRHALGEAAGGPVLGPARLADGVTVGNLASGQIPPAKIVCAVGMNGDGFPRNPPRYAFDLVEQDKRRPGDRDVRLDDRFAFLEALLAARTGFIVTYTGRDQRDDSEIPPSVVVDELADYINARFPDTDPVKHPLQAFSPRYFAGERELFSFSKTMLEAAKILRDGNRQAPDRFAVTLPEPDQSRRRVSLSELERFFSDPAAGLLRERFGIRLRGEEEAQDENEPLQLNGLERYGLREQIRTRTDEKHGETADPERVRSLLLASGTLPHGNFGALAWDDAFRLVDGLNKRLLPHAEALAEEPVKIDLEIGGFRLTGALPNIGEEHMVWWRNGRRRARNLIEIRLRQLAWVAAGNEPLPVTAVWIDEELLIPAPDPKEESVARWLEAWWSGLSAPLRFFPESSFAWARTVANGGGGPIDEARKKWLGVPVRSIPGECDELTNRLLWDSEGEEDPLHAAEFERLATDLLLPLASQL